MKTYLIKLIRNAALSLILITSSSTAFATEALIERLYFGVGIIQTDLNINKENIIAINGLPANTSFKNSGLGLNLMVGVNLDEYLSFELGAVDSGSVLLNNGLSTQEFISAGYFYTDAIIKFYTNNTIKTFAKFGVSYWSAYDQNDELFSDGIGLHYGVGLDINVYGETNRVMRLLWEHNEFDQVILNDSDSLSISILFHF